MTFEIQCVLCGDPVDPAGRFTYRRVTGWGRVAGVRLSGKQGGSDIACREWLDEYAHPHCVSRLKNGVAPAQGTLSWREERRWER